MGAKIQIEKFTRKHKKYYFLARKFKWTKCQFFYQRIFVFFPIEKWSRKLPRIFLSESSTEEKREQKQQWREMQRRRKTFFFGTWHEKLLMANFSHLERERQTYVCIPHENCDAMTFLIWRNELFWYFSAQSISA